MKFNFLFILILILISSCYEIKYSDGKEEKVVVLNKIFIPSHTEITYHYGYSISRGKFCFHFGPEEINDEYFIYFLNNKNDTIKYEINKAKYDSINIDDSIILLTKYRYVDDKLTDTIKNLK